MDLAAHAAQTKEWHAANTIPGETSHDETAASNLQRLFAHCLRDRMPADRDGPDDLGRRRAARSIYHEPPSLVVRPGQERPALRRRLDFQLLRGKRRRSRVRASTCPKRPATPSGSAPTRCRPSSTTSSTRRRANRSICPPTCSILVNLAADDKPDLRFLGWKKVGEFPLSAGRHSVRFRFYSKPQHHGALDAFVFTTEPFLPSGTQKPGQGGRLAAAEGTWPFLPERDQFRADALFDLRGLNEKVAGQSGFVRLSKDGESFVLGDGTPARFWAVTTNAGHERSNEDLAHHARFLAKRGVNMVRLHGHLNPKEKNSRVTDVDEKVVDEAWKLVAAMKKEGIYVTISPYWSASVKPVPARWGIDGWPENEAPFGLLFFNPQLQEGYNAWLKALLSQPNPYTGIPLAKDPALAIIQLQNEDSLLFWTAQSIKGKQAELLGAAVRRLAESQVRIAREGLRGLAERQGHRETGRPTASWAFCWCGSGPSLAREAASAGSTTSSSSMPRRCTGSTPSASTTCARSSAASN